MSNLISLAIIPLEKHFLEYSRLAKIDTAKIDTFYEISRNFEKINNTLFGLHKTRILGLRN